MTTTILIADDEPVQRRLLESHLNKMGYRVVAVSDGDEAIEALKGRDAASIGLLILDLVMPGLDGMGTLGKMRELGIAKPVIVQTAQGGIDTVVGAMRAGATDFCVKPVSFERLKISIQNALKLDAMEHAVDRIRKSSKGEFTFSDMIADSPAMARAIDLGKRASVSSIPVLLEGESGVGKEVMAKAIQGAGERRGKPFVAVNCGALPENLVESVLFGHEKGAFTNADKSHIGKFQEADGGTLFLDEVGELAPNIQVKLLRAIQEGEIDPVGARKPVKIDIRLISATNRDMIEQVREGQFREDLFYRLNVFPIMLPPLRKRRDDIPALVQHFTARFCLEEGRRNITGISRDALSALQGFDWPGNIRQLENTIFRAVILCDGTEITLDDIPQIALQNTAPPTGGDENVVRFETGPEIQQTAEPVSSPPLQANDVLTASNGDLRCLSDIEADAIKNAIDFHDGRMTSVAKSLGIGRSTLYRKLKEYGLDASPADTAGNVLTKAG